MYQTVLVPTDGSDAAVTAAQTAFALARQFDADVHAIHVVDPDSTDSAYAEDVVTAVEEAAVEVGVETTAALVESDDVHRAIVEYADTREVDCIVMGTHGQESLREHVLGSVTERTLGDSPVPVITVQAETVVTSDIDRLLVPTDGSAGARAATEHAIEFAATTGASLHTIHVVDAGDVSDGDEGDSENSDESDVLDALETEGKRAVEAIIDAARRADVTVEASVVSGVPHRAIEAYAEERDVDYVFMGTHGRTGVGQQLLGSTTERVVRRLDVPVVSVRPAESDE